MKNFYQKLIFIIFITISSGANARTVGNYIGIDLIQTTLRFSSDKKFTDKTINSGFTNPVAKTSYGFQYGYAVNILGLFVAPTLIYEFNDARNLFNRTAQYAEVRKDHYGKGFAKIKERYGAKLNIGYDITNNLGVYGLVGYAVNNYSSYNSIYYDKYYQEGKLSENPWATTNGKKTAPFFGGGLKIKIYNYWSINAEYNFTKFKIKTNAKTQQINDNTVISKLDDGSWHDNLFVNYKISTIKFGLNYNF